MSEENEPIEGEVEPAATVATPAEATPSAPAPYIKPAVPAQADTTPGGLLAVAVARGASVEELDRLLSLKERFDAEEARKAYTAAMARFKQNAPEIFKDKRVEFDTSSGQTSYSHATLGQVANVIASSLGEYGLSHAWSIVEQSENFIKVRCTVTHEAGHSEFAELGAGPDGSGGKNAIQAVASTVTYLERYTLLAITGMAAQEGDDDGAAGGTEYCTEEQIAELQALIDALGKKFLAKSFFNGMGKIESLEQLPAKRFKQALKVLEAKRNAGR